MITFGPAPGRGSRAGIPDGHARAERCPSCRRPGPLRASRRQPRPGTCQGTRPAHSRVSRQRTGGAGTARLATRVMWPTSPPIVTVAWATSWPRVIACPSGRAVTVIVTGAPGQAVTLTPVAATAAGPAVHALDTPPGQRRAGRPGRVPGPAGRCPAG